MPMKLCQEGICKTQLHSFTLIENKIPHNNLQNIIIININESSVAQFPADTFARAHADYCTDAYQWNAHDHLEQTIKRTHLNLSLTEISSTWLAIKECRVGYPCLL